MQRDFGATTSSNAASTGFSRNGSNSNITTATNTRTSTPSRSEAWSSAGVAIAVPLSLEANKPRSASPVLVANGVPLVERADWEAASTTESESLDVSFVMDELQSALGKFGKG